MSIKMILGKTEAVQEEAVSSQSSNVVSMQTLSNAAAAHKESMQDHMPKTVVRKADGDPDQQLVFGEVYVPNVPDSQGDVASAAEIQQMAYGFLAKGLTHSINLNHDGVECGAQVVESFIARKDDPDGFMEGAWVLGVHIPDTNMWSLVKTGELNGFSFEGMGFKKETMVKMSVPDMITGETDVVMEHSHKFEVRYGPNGEFIGGVTDTAPDGHYHIIKKGTATEMESGHNHRFSFVEGVLSAEIDNS